VNVSAPFFDNTTDPSASAPRESRLGQDAFLKLLTTQLANQDPLAPQENGEFLAKLTSIETSIKELAAAFATLAGTPDTQSTGN
jgi:flagellar basal-body rod modification protein FlgD